ncbi:ComEA family DNA-binding protein [Variovorax rhizosphaerae]|uniref:Helix-hairpin-helix domain-containing protein n=1 Tax=Variovorax rhizosphaerae TaxID=1836200 RepID=A0ABU8WU26_9BURK
MFKKIATAFVGALLAVSSFAAVEANKGTAAELDSLKGVGPAMSKRIVDARAQGEFKDWADFMHRVKGVKDKSAAKLSSEGLTINGQAFTPASKDEGKKKSGKSAASEPAATSAATASAPPATTPAATPAASPAASGPAMKAAVTPVVVQAAPAVAGAATAAAPAAKAASGK